MCLSGVLCAVRPAEVHGCKMEAAICCCGGLLLLLCVCVEFNICAVGWLAVLMADMGLCVWLGSAAAVAVAVAAVSWV